MTPLIISKNELRKSHFEVFIGAFSEIRAAIFIPLKLVILEDDLWLECDFLLAVQAFPNIDIVL